MHKNSAAKALFLFDCRFDQPVLFGEALELHAGFGDYFEGKVVRIALFIYDALYAGVDDHLGADYAGLMGAVKGGAFDGNA